jgi:hypothetical protein
VVLCPSYFKYTSQSKTHQVSAASHKKLDDLLSRRQYFNESQVYN